MIDSQLAPAGAVKWRFLKTEDLQVTIGFKWFQYSVMVINDHPWRLDDLGLPPWLRKRNIWHLAGLWESLRIFWKERKKWRLDETPNPGVKNNMSFFQWMGLSEKMQQLLEYPWIRRWIIIVSTQLPVQQYLRCPLFSDNPNYIQLLIDAASTMRLAAWPPLRIMT